MPSSSLVSHHCPREPRLLTPPSAICGPHNRCSRCWMSSSRPLVPYPGGKSPSEISTLIKTRLWRGSSSPHDSMLPRMYSMTCPKTLDISVHEDVTVRTTQAGTIGNFKEPHSARISASPTWSSWSDMDERRRGTDRSRLPEHQKERIEKESDKHEAPR
jgi:hypothetical protein